MITPRTIVAAAALSAGALLGPCGTQRAQAQISFGFTSFGNQSAWGVGVGNPYAVWGVTPYYAPAPVYAGPYLPYPSVVLPPPVIVTRPVVVTRPWYGYPYRPYDYGWYGGRGPRPGPPRRW